MSLKNDGESKKLLSSYIGEPFRVVEILGHPISYKIASIPGFDSCTTKRITMVAADRMLPGVHIAALQLNVNDSDTKSSDDEY